MTDQKQKKPYQRPAIARKKSVARVTLLSGLAGNGTGGSGTTGAGTGLIVSG